MLKDVIRKPHVRRRTPSVIRAYMAAVEHFGIWMPVEVIQVDIAPLLGRRSCENVDRNSGRSASSASRRRWRSCSALPAGSVR